MTLVERVCWCGKRFMARPADVRRGWAKACCKSHAAHVRERKLDRHGYRHRDNDGTQDLDAAAEREACAKVCEDFADGTSAYEVHHRFAAYKCADIIRKRGEDESIS